MDISETIAACDLKVGRCRQLIAVADYGVLEGVARPLLDLWHR